MTEPGSEVVLAGDFPLYNPDNDFRALALDTAYISEGFRLIDKEDLIGVPFVVKRIVYREGYPREGAAGDYVSVECIVADRATLDSEPVKAMVPGPLSVYPNEGVVFNDSGTGIRRELTRLCAQYGLIELKDPENADAPYQAWKAGGPESTAGFTGMEFGGKRSVYLALRGLRRSDYEWQGNPATTYYFG